MSEGYLIGLAGMQCEYDRLPEICQQLMPQYADISFKYNLIIIVGLLNILAMAYFAFLIRRFIQVKLKESGANSIGEYLKKR